MDFLRESSKKNSSQVIEDALRMDATNLTTGGIPHTPDHVDCPACARTGQSIMSTDIDLAYLPFSAAFPVWLDSRKRYLKPRVIINKESYGRALGVFFNRLVLSSIHPGHIREYQGMCERNYEGRWHRAAGPSAINHEVSTLSELLARAGVWKAIEPHYDPLPLPKTIPKRVLDCDEEKKFRDYVPTTDEEILAYLVATITNNTSVSGCELRGLRLGMVHIFGDSAEVRVPDDSVKNEYRARRVPLNKTARIAFEQVMELARRKGAFAPEHYLFPFRLAPPSEKKGQPFGRWDPARPASASWLIKSWNHLRKNAGLGMMRPHDFRHQFITRALEKGVDEKHLTEITGHISPRMLRHYSHIRMEAKRTLVDMLDSHAPAKKGRRRA